MKIRKGFVSNSSSSSFICDLTGGVIDGYDISLSDYGWYGCENGHYFCSPSVLRTPIKKEVMQWLKKEIDEYGNKYSMGDMKDAVIELYKNDDDLVKWENIEEFWGDNPYELPELFCPICMKEDVQRDKLFDYLLKTCGKSKEELAKEYYTLEEK